MATTYDALKTYYGIDFGTSTIEVSKYNQQNDKSEIIELDSGKSYIPSLVAYKGGKIFFGNEAKTQMRNTGVG